MEWNIVNIVMICQTLTNESNFSIEYPIKSWYAVKINQIQ